MGYCKNISCHLEFGNLTLQMQPPSPKMDITIAFIYLKHFWNFVFFSRHYLGGGPTFLVSLFFIGFLTAIIEQLGNLLGCVLGIRAAVTGITIIALGTSVPDTFASRTAALHDEGADAAIGNITGNSMGEHYLTFLLRLTDSEGGQIIQER